MRSTENGIQPPRPSTLAASLTARAQHVFQNTDLNHGCVSVIINCELAQPLAATGTQAVNKLRPRIKITH